MSQWQSGKRSDAKKIMMKLPDERGEDQLYLLDRSQIKALITLADSIRWMTRHYSLPSYVDTQIKLNDYADETANDLMTPIDFCSQLEACASTIEEMIANAIATSTSVQNALKDYILSNPDFIRDMLSVVTPLSPGEIAENLATGNPTCNHDKLWGQCKAIARHTHSTVLDVLEVLEVQSNNVELIEHLELLPFAKVAFAVVPVTDGVQFVNWLQENVEEMYLANWDASETPDGTEWKIAEEIFCLCEDDCEITIEDIFNAYSNLLSGTVSLSWETMAELVETVIGVNDNNLMLVYAMHGLLWGVAKLSTAFGTGNYDAKILGTILGIADASNDWEGIVECVPVTDVCEDAVNIDFGASDNGWYGLFSGGYGTWHEGEGFGIGSFAFSITVEKEISVPITKVRAYWAIEEAQEYHIRAFGGGGLGSVIDSGYTSGTDDNGWWTEFDITETTSGLCVQSLTSNSLQRLQHVCYW